MIGKEVADALGDDSYQDAVVHCGIIESNKENTHMAVDSVVDAIAATHR